MFWAIGCSLAVIAACAGTIYLQRRHLILLTHKLNTLRHLTHKTPGIYCYHTDACLLISGEAHKAFNANYTSLSELENGFQIFKSENEKLSLNISELIMKGRLREHIIHVKDHTHYELAITPLTDKNNSHFVLKFTPMSVSWSQEHIQKENVLLKTVLQTLPIAIWQRDIEGKIRFCNLSYAQLLQKSVDDVIKNQQEIIENKGSHSPFHMAVKAKATFTKQKEKIHCILNGSRKCLEITEIPLSNYTTIGFALDLTDNEETISKLTKNVKAYQDALNNITSPVAIFSSDTKLIYFNDQYLKTFQFDEAWLHSEPTFSEVIENMRSRRKLPEYKNFLDFKKESLKLFQSLLQPIQELLHLPDGTIFRMLIAPHPLGGLMYIYDDMTDKISLERGYNTLMAVQKETIDHLHEGVLSFGSDYTLRLINPPACQMWHVDTDKFSYGTHLFTMLEECKDFFLDEHSFKTSKETLGHLFAERKEFFGQIELRDNIVFMYAYTPLPDGGHLLSFVDISHHYHLERALREKNEALETADKLKSDFMSHVSYELKAPLNTIIGFSDILIQQYFGPLNEQQQEYCQGIVQSSNRLLMLINDILDLTIIESGHLTLKWSAIDLESFLQSAVGLVYNRANDQKVEVIIENNAPINQFVGDETRLKQAIFHLLNNAIKFTPSGGSITLKAYASDNETLCLEVIDNGIGISEADQEKIFKIFERGGKAFARQRGAGLGLPLVKMLIERHHGTLDIMSKEGDGTQVRCIIPLCDKNSEQLIAVS